jgi:hypothetical protein
MPFKDTCVTGTYFMNPSAFQKVPLKKEMCFTGNAVFSADERAGMQ